MRRCLRRQPPRRFSIRDCLFWGALCISDVIAELFAGGASVLYFLVIGCAGVNFLVEFAVNMILSPALWAVIRALERRSE